MNEVLFNDRKNGYDKSQVNEYIKKITDAYQEVHKDNVAMREKYESLLLDYKELEKQNQEAAEKSTEMIAKTLIDTEKLAKKIVANAKREEAKIMDLAAKSLESAYFALERAMDAVGLEAQKFIDREPKKAVNNNVDNVDNVEAEQPQGSINPDGKEEITE